MRAFWLKQLHTWHWISAALSLASGVTALSLMAMAALLGRRWRPVEWGFGAVARVSIVPRTPEAEYAILVSHFIAGQGLGRKLMQKLVKWARGKKLDRLYGDVLDSNQAMLQLALSLGFKRTRDDDTPGLVRVVLDLNE